MLAWTVEWSLFVPIHQLGKMPIRHHSVLLVTIGVFSESHILTHSLAR